MIAIVDYGMGNLRSVQKAIESLGMEATICTDPTGIAQAERLILPGVGAFRDAIGELQRQSLVEPIKAHIAAGKPFLGICLGLQLLFDVSFEDGTWQGLGVIPGEVVRFKDLPGRKIPHMGWNEVQVQNDSRLFRGIPNGSHFYFVHSYFVVPKAPEVIAAKTDYGGEFTSVIERGNLFATQFHPEKSQSAGLALLKNFASI